VVSLALQSDREVGIHSKLFCGVRPHISLLDVDMQMGGAELRLCKNRQPICDPHHPMSAFSFLLEDAPLHPGTHEENRFLKMADSVVDLTASPHSKLSTIQR
jgi:hypothetical protein